MLIWSSPRGASLQAAAGILRAHEFDTATEAVAVLESARTECEGLFARAQLEAADLLEAARTEAEAIQARATNAAHDLLEQAREEAVALAERAHAEASQEAASAWHARFAELQASHGEAMAGMERRLALVVATAVERMVHAEPREALLRRALSTMRDTLRDAGTARLRVHPADLAAARSALTVLDGDTEAPRVQVEADPGLAPGSSVFDADIGRLDTSLAVQLAGLRGALERAVRHALDAPPSDEDDGEDDGLYGEEHGSAADAAPENHDGQGDGTDAEVTVAYARRLGGEDAATSTEHDDD
ncbi:type III secretion system stator protein SctL [Paracidovorax konjaci]|uniref:Flagellar assembly protein FliH n=1 Tax=Paracidovorax konjaci TaxID=32040 RepID=A0A1I1V4X9_9BURK|nr:type III secretion system stator protein SctL [Paracidovorax konjaci]SFD78066.1 type III secretion protein L [Paracidovorax konjaci]